MRLSDEPGPYDDAFGRWLRAHVRDAREKARVTMPGERARSEYYTFDSGGRMTHASRVATESITLIRDSLSHQSNRPFFVHAGFYAPHPPLNPPVSTLSSFRDRALPPRRFHKDVADNLTRADATP